jgi:hypothetical protein
VLFVNVVGRCAYKPISEYFLSSYSMKHINNRSQMTREELKQGKESKVACVGLASGNEFGIGI